MNTVIKVENLSKQYRLGDVGTGTLSHDLKRWWHKSRGKDDPYLQVGETNDRSKKGSGDYVWALKDINFEVKAGEVLGIIGRNGAGKSTLLKILSKTTTPTTGSIKVKGRIASLLEVGTGFHPELTGRENIFLNGAILGMTRREIESKFDEIVDFSGVERYIDTPVKRYSSGMYVRLAFAVAAHLEPEILIVDEVLAVGDAEFQKKCLGKMKDVSVNEGRTVLFVSHNISAIESLCNIAAFLDKGALKIIDNVSKVCRLYSGTDAVESGIFELNKINSSDKIVISKVVLKDSNGTIKGSFQTGENIRIEITLNSKAHFDLPYVWIVLKMGNMQISSAVGMIDGFRPKAFIVGDNLVSCSFNALPLLSGAYTIHMGIRDETGMVGLTTSIDVAHFNIVTLPSEIGLNGTLADIIAPEIASPLIPYNWEFQDGKTYKFDILNYIK